MTSSFRRHALACGLVALLAHPVRSHAYNATVVDEWTLPQHEHLLVARLYRVEHNVHYEVPGAFLALLVDGDRVTWLPLRADSQLMSDQLSLAADAAERGRDESGNGGVFADKRLVTSRGRVVTLHLVDRAHARQQASSVADRDANGVKLALRQQDGALEADVTGFVPSPLHASFPLGEAWPIDVAAQRDCLAAGSAYAFCELVRRFDWVARPTSVQTSAPLWPIWIVRLHAQTEAPNAAPSYLFLLFSTRDSHLHKSDRFVQWFVAQPRDAAERAQLDGWVAAGGARGPALSPRLTDEIARQRATAFAGDLSDRDRSFVPGFYFDRPDGTSLVAKADGSGPGDRIYFIVGRGNALAELTGLARDVAYAGALPIAKP
ncbi:MAG TPA: hypothetical protein VIA18_07725 [Polyangia bacterium]|nr:hypothetical protein [Polyangia bacterium]